MIRKLLALGFAILISTTLASANDAFTESGIGGISIGKTDQISISSEKLFLSQDKVDVEYEFLNHSDKAIQTLISFPLPAVAICTEEARDFGHCNDEAVLGLKFETWIDGKKLSPVRSVEQIVTNDSDEKDHSSVLKKFGLTRVLSEENASKISKLSEISRSELESAGLITWRTWCDQVLWTENKGADGKVKYIFKDKDITDTLRAMKYSCPSYPECTGHVNSLSESDKLALSQKKWIVLSPKKDILLNWFVRKTFYWEQEFKPGVPLKIKHAYKPIVGVAQALEHTVKDDGSYESRTYCIDSSTKSGIIKRAKAIQRPGMANSYSWLKYILKSANSWSGPIRSYELTLKKRDKKEIISTCFKGLKKVDDVTFRASLKDFAPQEDISVLFF